MRGKFVDKIRNFDRFGAVFPHFCPDKCEIWHEVPVKCHVYRSMYRLCGTKNIFEPLSKRNTGMATLRAGLPVIQVALLSQRDRAMLRVTEYFAKSLKVIRNNTV